MPLIDDNPQRPIKYRTIPHIAIPLGFNTFLIHRPGTDFRITVRVQLKDALDCCQVADTISGLTARAQNRLQKAYDDCSWVPQAIRELAGRGLIVVEASLIPQELHPSPSIRRVTSIAFPTADRIDQLRRAVSSYDLNAREYGRTLELVVMDDSRSVSRERHVSCLKGAEVHCSIRYGGRLEKDAYTRLLIREGIDPDLARFALLGEFNGISSTTGANRNAVLLDTLDRFIISVDDDTVCKLAIHPDRTGKLYLRDSGDPRDKWFYPDRDHVWAHTICDREDFVARHEDLLGKPIATLLSDAEECVFDGTCDRILRATGNDRARVAATMSGVAGDSGMYSSNSLLGATGGTLMRLCESEDSFRCALQSREVLHVVRGPTVTHRCPVMAYALGLANEDTLPPFLPIGRNQDGFFGFLLGQSTPHFVGHIPVAVFHLTEVGKQYQPFPLCRIADLVTAVLSLMISPWRGMPLSLQLIGQTLVEVGRTSDTDFWDLLFQALSKQRAEHLRATDGLLRRHPEYPDFWKREVGKSFEHSVAELQDPYFPIPGELKNCQSIESARQSTRKLISLLGRLLLNWPDIVEASRRLRQREQRISTDLHAAEMN